MMQSLQESMQAEVMLAASTNDEEMTEGGAGGLGEGSAGVRGGGGGGGGDDGSEGKWLRL